MGLQWISSLLLKDSIHLTDLKVDQKKKKKYRLTTETSGSDWIEGKTSSSGQQPSSGTIRLPSLCPWRLSRPTWSKPRATLSDLTANSILSGRLD